MESKFKKIVRELVKEIESETELDEMTGTSAVAGYDTPAAFAKPGQTKKKNNRLASVTGGTVVNNLEEGEKEYALGGPSTTNEKTFKQKPTATKSIDGEKIAKLTGGEVVNDLDEAKDWLKTDVPANLKKPLQIKPTATDSKDDGTLAANSSMLLVRSDAEKTLKENRWLELKREESSPKSKVGRGVSNIHKQLSEIEKFVNWYSKIKTENGLKKEDYWKRTNASLYKIRERLMGITEKLRTL